jgi:hypothetical protein
MVTSRVIPDAIADGGVPCFFITLALAFIRPTLAPGDEGSLIENVNTPHDHARARGWAELNEKPSEDRITE